MNPLQKASHNQMILKWWQSCDEDFRQRVIVAYAKCYNWPIQEVNPDMTGDADLSWLWFFFAHTIALFAEEYNEQTELDDAA